MIFCLSFYLKATSVNYIYGDQVHYLVMTNSLLEDGDLDLKNDHEEKRYNDYYEGYLTPHVLLGDFGENTEHWYSIHNPGLSIVLVPILLFGGIKGAFVFMLLVSFSLLLASFFWVKRVINNNFYALLSVLVLFFSPFYMGLSGYIFADLVLALMLVLSFLIICNQKKSNSLYFLFGIILGCFPWIHVKGGLIAALLGLLMLFQISKIKLPIKGKIFKALLFVVPSFLLLILFEWKLYQWYGVVLPTSTFASSQMFEISSFKTVLAVLFDSSKGLLVNNPMYFLFFLGLPLWARINKSQFIKVLLVVFPMLVLQLSFGDWWGGWSSPGRYYLEYLPLLLPSIAFSLMILKKLILKIIVFVLLILQTLFSVVFILIDDQWVMPDEFPPLFSKLKEFTGLDFFGILPQFNKFAEIVNSRDVVVYILLLFIFVLFLYGLKINKRLFSSLIKVEKNTFKK